MGDASGEALLDVFDLRDGIVDQYESYVRSFVPIVDWVLRNPGKPGIKAIVVYPMNALANSQLGEAEKFLSFGFSRPPVTYARYTGQESRDERERIRANPPDVLLTNFMMLEL